MAKLARAQQLLSQAEVLDPSSSSCPSPQRDALLQQAQSALKTALALTDTPDPASTPPPSPLLPSLPTHVDPALPPHILTLLGRTSVLLGPSHYKAAEAYYTAALRCLVEAGREEEEKEKGGGGGKGRGKGAGVEGMKAYFDARVLDVGRQLGWLFYLMDNDVAAEAALLRCLQLLAELREGQQKKAVRVNLQGEAKAGAEGRAVVDPSEYSDDVTAELSEQLSGVYRKRGDFNRAVEWASNALKMNDKAETAAQSGEGGEGASLEEATLPRRMRAVHLYTALASDFFALHLAPVTKQQQTLHRSPNSPSPLDDAYHASVHSLEKLEQLIDAADVQQPPSAVPSSSPPRGKARPTSSPSFTTPPRSPAAPSPPLRSAPQAVLPSTSHLDFLSSPRVLRVLSMPPSAVLPGLLTEVVACYANLASVLSAGGKEEDADRAWGLATKAAKLSGDPALLDIIAEQQAMLRPGDSEQLRT